MRAVVGRVVFWFVAVAVGLAMLAPFIYAGSGTCAAAEEFIEDIVVADGETLTFSVTTGSVRVSSDGTYAGGASHAAPAGDTVAGPNTFSFFCDNTDPYEYTAVVSGALCVDNATCTDTDVVLGLSQISAQIQGLSAFVFVVTGFCTFVLVSLGTIAFVGFHRGR